MALLNPKFNVNLTYWVRALIIQFYKYNIKNKCSIDILLNTP